MKRGKFLVLLAGLLLAGCIPSLHQLYTDKDAVYDPKLLGKWQEPNSTELWEFRPAEPNSYLLVFTDQKNNIGKFNVHLVRVDSMLFLDIFPADANQLSNEFYKLHFYRVHTFAKVNQIEPSLRVQLMNKTDFTRRLSKEPMLLKHEIIENRPNNEAKIVITASTKELQDFMIGHAEDENVFGKETILNHPVPKISPPAETNKIRK